ncbi:MAG: adenylate/guanylate cyclase domain-containing protein [Candidatus Brevundimonas phytovorans]|nr:adenylate/guanylate cyclase domain-containing protein [Brevundimonas sp.]WEK58850.1 MAG: adenylate/guanylate cyclase domain-containing protein [Brevundimonas sp.]
MTWSHNAAAERIERHRQNAPETDIKVSEFAEYMRSRRTLVETARAADAATSEPLWFVPRNRAVTTHGAHIYANLLEYNTVLMEAGRETEASHERALQLLHLHYSACEHLLAAFDIERVDFHGSRLHAVVLTPEGRDREAERINKAIAFAAAFREMVAEGGRRYDDLQTSVRIGIDSGPAVAVNSGRRSEPEPLFIGSPANHAAKLAAGDVPGIYLTPRAQAVRTGVAPLAASRISEEVERNILRGASGQAPSPFRRSFEDARSRFIEDQDALVKANGGVRPAVFNFHYREPPLRSIRFQDHPPSNTIRLELASLFADIDGFTAYVDNAIATGGIARAVANLHVLRAEMADVLQLDFGGRKVRFIGDCLHGVLAVGTAREVDARETVRRATMAAAGIRSSFDLCKKSLTGIETLGIAIGIEYGPTPICRLGLRGEASIRCSSSKATCVSEARQGDCNGTETAIGDRAYREGGAMVQKLFGPEHTIRNLTYPSAVALLQGLPPGPSIHVQEPLQAHLSL